MKCEIFENSTTKEWSVEPVAENGVTPWTVRFTGADAEDRAQTYRIFLESGGTTNEIAVWCDICHRRWFPPLTDYEPHERYCQRCQNHYGIPLCEAMTRRGNYLLRLNTGELIQFEECHHDGKNWVELVHPRPGDEATKTTRLFEGRPEVDYISIQVSQISWARVCAELE